MELLSSMITNLILQNGGEINDDTTNPFGEMGVLISNGLEQRVRNQSDPDITMFTERYLIPAFRSPTLTGFSDKITEGIPDLFYIIEQRFGSLQLCSVALYNYVEESYTNQINHIRDVINMMITQFIANYTEIVEFLVLNGVERGQIEEIKTGWNSVCTKDAWRIHGDVEHMREN